MKKSDIIKSYQIPSRITMGIFNLPCVKEVKKNGRGGFYYRVDDYRDSERAWHKVSYEDGDIALSAHPTDWLCYAKDGNWYVLTDKEYNELKRTIVQMRLNELHGGISSTEPRLREIESKAFEE